MNSCKFLFIIAAFTFFATTNIYASNIDSVIDGENVIYTRAQVDSILSAELHNAVAEEVSRQVDNELLELKIDKISNDKLSKLQSTHDGWVIGIVTILVAITGIVVPLIINQNREKKIKELEEKLQGTLETIQKSAKTAEESAKIAEFSVLLSRALSNPNIELRISILSRIIKEYKDYNYVSSAYNCRGIAYNKKGIYDKAILDYTNAVEKNPNFADAYYNRGNSYAQQGKWDIAIADFSAALKINFDFTEAYKNRAFCYAKIGEHEKAIVDYSNAITRDQDDAKAIWYRGISYEKLGENIKAAADFENAKKIDPKIK